MELSDLASKLRQFAQDRDWEQFHSPKNLAMALSVEAAELLEHFQWLTQSESRDLDVKKHAAVSEEIADIQIYLVRLADQLGVDIEATVAAKLESNSKKYPVSKVRGSAMKYSEYED